MSVFPPANTYLESSDANSLCFQSCSYDRSRLGDDIQHIHECGPISYGESFRGSKSSEGDCRGYRRQTLAYVERRGRSPLHPLYRQGYSSSTACSVSRKPTLHRRRYLLLKLLHSKGHSGDYKSIFDPHGPNALGQARGG